MRRGLFLAFLLAALGPCAGQAALPDVTMDVAPTTLDLKSGVPGLFFVTNHGSRPVTVQIEAMDWRQQEGRDRLTPSNDLLVSPPMARIAPGARQSVRVMARGARRGERDFRLLVGQLPDAAAPDDGVRVLLQFSVPVFVDHDPRASAHLEWSSRNGMLMLANAGAEAAKLEGLTVDGVPRGGLFYLLPGSARALGPLSGPAQVRVHDGRAGQDSAADVQP